MKPPKTPDHCRSVLADCRNYARNGIVRLSAESRHARFAAVSQWLLPAATGVIMAIHDKSRTMEPRAGHPNATGRAIRPVTWHPSKIHARTGWNGLNHCHRRGYRWRCANNRRRDDDRHGQPDGEAEADSGIGLHGSRADERGQQKHFGFHNLFEALWPCSYSDAQVTGWLHFHRIYILPYIRELQPIRIMVV